MYRVRAGRRQRICGLAYGVEIRVGGHRARRIGVRRARAHTGLAAVVRHAEDHFRRRHFREVLAGRRRVVVVVARQRSGWTKAEADAARGRARVVRILEVVRHDEKGIGHGGQAQDVEKAQRIHGGAGVGVDREIRSWRHRTTHGAREVAESVLGEGGVSGPAASVETLVVDVHAIHAFGLHLGHRLADRRGLGSQSRAHAGRAGAEVLKDDRQHDLRTVRMGRGQQRCQLARVPYVPGRVGRESAVGLYVETEERDS